MPRQLPWTVKGAGRIQANLAPARQAAKPRVSSAIEGDFFDDTVLASGKGEGRAIESDDDLPKLPAEPSTPLTRTGTKDAPRKRREESSSPPPVDKFEQPCIESMHKGVSRFDLRDDEWMMVEDEFLETAKLFTRHLHMAEYEKLKKTIEEKKKQAEIARPVVANAKLSTTALMKEKAKVQEQKQKRAIRDVFASQNNDDDEGEAKVRDTAPMRTNASRTTSSFLTLRNPPTSSPKQPLKSYEAQESDSEDLDASRPLKKPASKAITTPRTTQAHISSTSAEQTPALPTSTKTKASIVKPAPPSIVKQPRLRLSGATPFDMLDEYIPKKSPQSSPQISAEGPTKPPVARHTSTSSTKSSSVGCI
ncbi:hypothetical protein Ptr902_01809 [Pyrenophora tritici-repentis]|nr:hypothetical protein Alg215_02982 [Pyrenophora tritici-repentis]KAI0592574.1 hypothetical protein Alg130_00199 [Pyrenophora tritici-repentis]KAI0615119.1 hypothetical protein TUN205_00680 [Pyrenophora tritici-repentis]KAI0627422.1 hypothetical protein TUN199_00656 [Pyrenophora tritici-repentis]KAI2487676.1 hypothetical protein Ptr902_01809 [Pyrenophora tritici-repentis]